MSEQQGNPWNAGIILAAVVLFVLGGLFTLCVLVALTMGVQFVDGQNPAAQYYAGGLLALIAFMIFRVHHVVALGSEAPMNKPDVEWTVS